MVLYYTFLIENIFISINKIFTLQAQKIAKQAAKIAKREEENVKKTTETQ